MNLRFGLDLVPVASVEQALADEGSGYVERVFTAAEALGSRGSRGVDARRLAERLAVKAATRKVLPAAAESVDPREIELVTEADGRLGVALHGRAAELAAAAGISHVAVSVTRDSRLAAAVVAAQIDDEPASATEASVGVATTR